MAEKIKTNINSNNDFSQETIFKSGELQLLRCSTVINKIAANNILDKEEVEKLTKEMYLIFYKGLELKKAEERMVGHEIKSTLLDTDLKKFYDMKLKRYEVYIDLLNIEVNDIENLPENFEKFIKLTSQLKIYDLTIDVNKYTEILFALLMNELTFLSSQSVFDSLSEADILLIVEYLKKKIPQESELYKRLEKDIIDKKELYNILKIFASEKINQNGIDFNSYSDEQKRILEEKLQNLSRDRIATIKAIETYQAMSDLGKLDQIDKEIEELYSLKKEEKQQLKKRLLKKVLANGPLKVDFGNVNIKFDNKLFTAGRLSFLIAAIMFINSNFLGDYHEYNANKTTMTTKNGKIKNESKSGLQSSSEEMEIGTNIVKITYYSPWEYNGEIYEREVIKYSLNNIDYNNLEDYTKLDLNNFEIIEKSKETTGYVFKSYRDEYFEVEKVDIISEANFEETFFKSVVIMLEILIFSIFDMGICGLLYDDDDKMLVSQFISLIKKLSLIQIKIDKKEKVTQEDIDKLKESITQTEKEIELKLIERQNIQNSEQIIKELQTKLEGINKLLLAFENPEMIYTVNPGEHVYEQPKGISEEEYALKV